MGGKVVMGYKRLGWLSVLAALVVGCASTPQTAETPSETAIARANSTGGAYSSAQRSAARGIVEAAQAPSGPPATFRVEFRDAVGQPIAGLLELRNESNNIVQRIPIRQTPQNVAAPSGAYSAFSYVYGDAIPFLVDIQRFSVTPDNGAVLSVSVLEGTAGGRPLRTFDQDFDLAIDSLEMRENTDPNNPMSAPGLVSFSWPSPVLKSQTGWYKGELHAHSAYGIGSESVKELIKRAERTGLDFLAITDRGTLESAIDPAYQSNSVVLIPAMEWGDDRNGVALIYGPRAYPNRATSFEEAQAVMLLTQAQGGVCAVAHPLFPTAPWQWELGYMNAVEVWCRDWRNVPPTALASLDPKMQERAEGRLIHSVAIAAATNSLSANAQASLFWDLETIRGLKASVIAGSYSSSPKVPLGSPITYVYAQEKSFEGILDGLRRGRTFVSRGADGPTAFMSADILDDGSIDAIIGDVVPLEVPTRFIIEVQRGMGKRLEILLNGRPIRTIDIESDAFTYTFMQVPEYYGVYRARVVELGATPAFGYLDVLAMSSPIYSQKVVPIDGAIGDNAWVDIPSEYIDPEVRDMLVPREHASTEIKPKILNP